MNLHEFQAKELLASFGIQIPRGRVAASGPEAEAVARRLGLSRCVVKAQVHAGDRFANGGIRFTATPAEAGGIASELIGHPLVTAQTGPAGLPVRWVYVEEAVEFARSFYCAITLDRAAGGLVVIASRCDGAGPDWQAAAGLTPEYCGRVEVPGDGAAADFERAAGALGLEARYSSMVTRLLSQLAEAAVALDATLVEISPLVLSRDDTFVALDAKMILDDNALFRHPDLAALRDVTETEDEDPFELATERHQINYLRLDGDIGVVVNGAGLALATLDLLHDAGGRPANFMDIRTTATSLDIAYAFELIIANPRVRAVLVNVHGGGMQRCDTIADGIGIAVRRRGCRVPIVVRLAGNNADFASARLKSYGVPALEIADMWEAANTAVHLATRKAA